MFALPAFSADRGNVAIYGHGPGARQSALYRDGFMVGDAGGLSSLCQRAAGRLDTIGTSDRCHLGVIPSIPSVVLGLRLDQFDRVGLPATPLQCARPYTVRVASQVDPETMANQFEAGKGTPFDVTLNVRCRKCQPCIQWRRIGWLQRVTSEMTASARSWFITLTVAPTANLGHTDASFNRAVTLFLKRLRERIGSAGALRYISVTEHHKSGMPHGHLIIHDLRGCIPYRAIRASWSWGFMRAKLIDESVPLRAARYVTKYIAKEGGRIRASIRYGRKDVASTRGCIDDPASPSDARQGSGRRVRLRLCPPTVANQETPQARPARRFLPKAPQAQRPPGLRSGLRSEQSAECS